MNFNDLEMQAARLLMFNTFFFNCTQEFYEQQQKNELFNSYAAAQFSADYWKNKRHQENINP